MNSFRTELTVFPGPFEIAFTNPVFTIGSCFSDSIGLMLRQSKFGAAVNTMGILYSPLAIHKAIDYVIGAKSLPAHRFVEQDGLWHAFDFNASFSSPSRALLEKNIESARANARTALSRSDIVIITFGSAWIFEHRETREVVANCHKIPSRQFEKRLLDVDSICDSFETMLQSLASFRPGIKIILTVSPVRHLKDTLALNSVSKSVLRLAAHRIVQKHSDVEYFPAFEIMNDDLRDYRFYTDDMIHPSPAGIGYIWEKFAERYFSASTRSVIRELTALRAAIDHRPFHPEGAAHQKFLQETLTRLTELNAIVGVEMEMEQIRTRLKSVSL